MNSPACIVCGGSAGFRAAFAGLERCEACGFVTHFASSGFDPAKIYDAGYFAGGDYPDYLGQEVALRRSMRRHLEQMKRYVPLGGSLLEIACAYGFFLDEARAYFREVVGVDIAADAVAYAKQRFNVDARAGDLLQLDFGEKRFDVIAMWDAIEHLERPDEYLSRARSLLRPGGTVFLTTGDIGSWNARLRGERWRQIHPPSHLHYFSRETMRRLFERTGFEVLGFETAAYFHTAANVFGTLALRGGMTGRLAKAVNSVLPDELAVKIGAWVDLRDIMFAAARAR